MNQKQNLDDMDLLADPANATPGADQQSHGDVRRAAYLKRRAVYQQQAQTSAPQQAGAPLVTQRKG